MARAGALILHNGRVLLIERRREAETYYLFPGGRIEPGETPEEALVREVREELGLDVAARRLVAEVTYNGDIQSYYIAELITAVPAAFAGDEAADAVWLPIDGLSDLPVRPAAVACLVEGSATGWPTAVVRVVDRDRSRAA